MSTTHELRTFLAIALAWLKIARRHPGDVDAIESAAMALGLAQAALERLEAA